MKQIKLTIEVNDKLFEAPLLFALGRSFCSFYSLKLIRNDWMIDSLKLHNRLLSLLWKVFVLEVNSYIYSSSLKTSHYTYLLPFWTFEKESLMRSHRGQVDSDSPRVDSSFCSNFMGRLDIVILKNQLTNFLWSSRPTPRRVDLSSSCQKPAYWILLYGSTHSIFESTRALQTQNPVSIFFVRID